MCISSSIKTLDNNTYILSTNNIFSKKAYLQYGIQSNQIVDVNIGYGVEVVADSAFQDCINLSNIVLPESISCIQSYAFGNCEQLVSISLPKNLLQLNNSAFSNCFNLVSADIPALNYIDECMFENCISLQKLQLNNNISAFKRTCFFNCRNLSSINIPKNLATIENHAFDYCLALSNIDLSNCNISSIDYTAAELAQPILKEYLDVNYQSLIEKSKYIYDSNAYLYNNNVLCNYVKSELINSASVQKLKHIVIEDGIQQISSCQFESMFDISSISLPNSILSIDDFAFHRCHNLVSVNLPQNLQHIGKYAFGNCFKLQEINISPKVMHIGKAAFKNCISLSNVNLTLYNMKYIPEYMFMRCAALKEICLYTNQLKSFYISNNAFDSCFNLEKLHINGIQTLLVDYEAFSECFKLSAIDNIKHIFAKSSTFEKCALTTQIQQYNIFYDDKFSFYKIACR